MLIFLIFKSYIKLQLISYSVLLNLNIFVFNTYIFKIFYNNFRFFLESIYSLLHINNFILSQYH